MRKALFILGMLITSSLSMAQVISISTVTTNTGGVFGFGSPTISNTTYTTTTQRGTNTYSSGRDDFNDLQFSNSPGAGSLNTNINNGYNSNYGNNGYNYGNNSYGNSYTNYNNNNSYNYNNTYNNQSTYTSNNDGYGSTIELENGDGTTRVIETTTDSTQAEANKSIKDKIDAHMVHFTGLVMSDMFNEGNLSKAYVMDKYSEFLKPGKYSNISTNLPNSVAFTFDGIAIPPKTRLIIYSGTNFTGSKLVDITGPAIINNNKWEFDERYTGANRKTYCPELQSTFPQNVRKWSNSNMHDWQNGSIEIQEVTE
jgi:hypothetical protein